MVLQQLLIQIEIAKHMAMAEIYEHYLGQAKSLLTLAQELANSGQVSESKSQTAQYYHAEAEILFEDAKLELDLANYRFEDAYG